MECAQAQTCSEAARCAGIFEEFEEESTDEDHGDPREKWNGEMGLV